MLPPEEMERLIELASKGDKAAMDQLFSLLYEDLRKAAGRFFSRERADHTLRATALVHEAYLRLLGKTAKKPQNVALFFTSIARAMQRILVEYARSHGAKKRGRGLIRLDWNEELALTQENLDLVLAVDDALKQLQKMDPRKADIVRMRFFAGFTEEEVGLILGLSDRTVKRDWKFAKAWLRDMFGDDPLVA